MAIIIRENKVINSNEYKNIEVFKSDKVTLTTIEERNARDLDNYLHDLFKRLKNKLDDDNILSLKKKSGVIKLWYMVGKELQFIDNPTIIDPSDKKYIWKALWYHAGELTPGEMKSRAGTIRDHFFYCYRIAKYDEDFVLAAGNWRTWGEFFDSPILSNDKVLLWFEKKIPDIKKLNLKNWLRDFIKLIRNEFQNIDMSFLTSDEIQNKLEIIFSEFVNESKK
ncbi:MAG: hypothetical protein HYV29_10660 [Ignavibacteriales bacterium]|nr:hypothetical protein [Ignavibacteriales bacterium]